MKVTLFKDMKAEGWYSMDRYAESLIQQFKAQGLKFQVFCAEPPLKITKVRRFWRANVYPNFGRFFQREVNHILDHSYGHLLNILNPKRTVVTCHDLIPLDFEDDLSVLAGFREIIKNLIKAAKIIAVSESTKADLINKLGIDDHKISVVYSGVDPIFRPFDSLEIKKAARRKFNLPEGKIVLNFGSNLKYKNVETVLRAFKEILDFLPSVYLLRIHPLSDEQKKLAQDLGILSNYLEVLSPSDEDLVKLYNCGDVFLSPSLKEGFGLHVLEALACGLTVVVSKDTSLQELVGDVGVLIDCQNISEIASKTASVLRGDLVIDTKRIAERSELFNWPKTAEQTASVYWEVVAGL